MTPVIRRGCGQRQAPGTKRIPRRRLLQLGIGASALFAASGGLLAWFRYGYRLRPGEAAIGLDDKQLCIARALVEALFPERGDLPSGVALGVHQRIDQEAWASDPETRADIGHALELIEHAPPLLGRLARLSSLPAAERAELFSRMMRHGWDTLAQAACALRQLCVLFYFARDEIWPAIGYDGPWVDTPRPPESALAYAELLAARGARP